MWVFGYGSLTWNVDFPYEEFRVGYVTGFSRRFWQGDVDHRGIPGACGRVVTLVENEQECVWGMAYKLADHQVNDVIAHLDRREKCGYHTIQVTFYPKDVNPEPFTVAVYFAPVGNPWYLGPASLDQMAREIASRSGPKGHNSEYLLRLAETVRNIIPEQKDDHLFELEAKVKELMALAN